MGEQDRRTDAVEERDASVAIELLLLGELRKRWDLARIKLVEHGVARLPRAPPLGVQMRLRPKLGALWRDEALVNEADARWGHRAVHLRPMGGASARHLIDNVDGVAAAEKILRPALAPVRRAGEIGAGLAAAVNHNDGIGMLEVLRNLKFHIHLSEHRRAFDGAIDPASHE